MSSLIAMAVHDTEENERSKMTWRTIESIYETVDFSHRFIIIDNGSCKETADMLSVLSSRTEVITLPSNIGTARAHNLAWKQRKPGEHCIKIDNDVVIYESGWVEKLEACIEREPKIGQIALKRKDCWETTWHQNEHNRSELVMLPHEPGQPWIIVEKVKHVIGTCVLHSAALLDKVGYLYQPGLYGYDDTLMTARAIKEGFMTCFLSNIEIDHIDPGGTDYQKWKERESGQYTGEVVRLMKGYADGSISTYYGPNGEHE